MKNKKLFLIGMISCFFISLFFSSNVSAIINDNDINFSWITSNVYEENNPSSFDVSNTLNLTTYNNTDYFEHVQSFDFFNYTQDDYNGTDNIEVNYPDNDGLLYSVDNLNMSLYQSTISLKDAGTYTFYDDTLNDLPNNFTCHQHQPYSVIEVLITDYEPGYIHDHVLYMARGAGTGSDYYATSTNYFDNQTYGTVEFWFTGTAVQSAKSYGLDLGIVSLRCYGHWQYNPSASGYITVPNISDPINNIWYHVRIDFETTTGNYMGLSQNQCNITINDESSGSLDLTLNDTPANYMSFSLSKWDTNYIMYVDNIGYSWDFNYEIGSNYYFLPYNTSYSYSWLFLNATSSVICNITSINGYYFVNDVNINYNIFNDILDSWLFKININQISFNATIYFYNESNSLLFNNTFDTVSYGNIKYIEYVQYYQNTNHYIYVSNLSMYSNDTMIAGNNAFLSYQLDLIDVTSWNTQVNSLLVVEGHGKYRFWISNSSYVDNSSIKYPLSDWVKLNENDVTNIDVSSYSYNIENPYLIVETMNGMYLLSYISIQVSGTQWILSDNTNAYEGTLDTSNIDTDISYFYISNGKLYYQITYNDTILEYMQLSFNINNIDALNYQLLYSTYLNISNDDILNQFNFKYTDLSYTKINIAYLYKSDIEVLSQDKSIDKIEFLISNNELMGNNETIYGYIDGFTLNYSEQLSISIFANNMLLMLIPLIIILSMTFALSYVFRSKSKREPFNKKAFFPIFFIVSILVFIFGFYDTWILFVIIVSGIIYLINKRDEYT